MRSGSNITEQYSTDATFAQASNKTMTQNKTNINVYSKQLHRKRNDSVLLQLPQI